MTKSIRLCVGILLLTLVPLNQALAGASPPPVARGHNPGFSPAELQAVDGIVSVWMRETETPGLSFAFTDQGRLVLARAYGYADVERGEAATPQHRFRIASVSKPITAVAIMKLAAAGKLALDNRLFGESGWLGNRFGNGDYHAWTRSLTVDHLLTHTGGAWGNRHNDPMFVNAQWSLQQLIDYTLDSSPLAAAPGRQYDYSNFGYAILGQLIRRMSRQTYDSYVQQAVLYPAGVRSMAIAGSTLRERQPQEVRYSNVNYARGWSVNSANNYWHTGSLPGTSAILVRAHDGVSWAALANSRPAGEKDAASLDRLMWQVRRAISRWPQVDLFAGR